jgi:hypothetical protein
MLKTNPANIEDFKHMGYICVEIVTRYKLWKNGTCIWNPKLLVEFLGDFFCGEWC